MCAWCVGVANSLKTKRGRMERFFVRIAYEGIEAERAVGDLERRC